MSYIKGGIVTRIDVLNYTDRVNYFLNKNFNLNLFDYDKNCYLLKSKILNNNFWIFREELLDFIDSKSDSIKNSDCFIIEKSICKVENSNIIMFDDNKKYYFDLFNEHVFDMEVDIFYKNLKIWFIVVYWDINSLVVSDFSSCSSFVNNLTRKALKNTLKDVSWITVL